MASLYLATITSFIVYIRSTNYDGTNCSHKYETRASRVENCFAKMTYG